MAAEALTPPAGEATKRIIFCRDAGPIDNAWHECDQFGGKCRCPVQFVAVPESALLAFADLLKKIFENKDCSFADHYEEIRAALDEFEGK